MLKSLNELLNFLSTIASFALFYLLNSDSRNKKMLHLNCISTHSSMRYKRFFDIIELVCRFIIELQIRSKIKQFEH